MKKILLFFFSGLLLLAIGTLSFTSQKAPIDSNQIQWHSLESALQAHQKNGKKIFIDFYTDWCGWCKVMDKKTFTDPRVIELMNENFYAVKFDAEQKGDVVFKGKKYNFVPAGKRGIHTFAMTLLEGRMSYPSFVILDEKLQKIETIKGYKTPDQLVEFLEAEQEKM